MAAYSKYCFNTYHRNNISSVANYVVAGVLKARSRGEKRRGRRVGVRLRGQCLSLVGRRRRTAVSHAAASTTHALTGRASDGTTGAMSQVWSSAKVAELKVSLGHFMRPEELIKYATAAIII